MRYKNLIILSLLVLLLACKEQNDAPSQKEEKLDIEEILIGDWRITDFQIKLLIPLSPTQQRGFDDAVQTNARLYREKSHFSFTEDHKYVMDFKGEGADTGTWQITSDKRLAYYTEVYKWYDTIHFKSISEDQLVLEMKNPDQIATVTIQRK
jgi:hypothetical protein